MSIHRIPNEILERILRLTEVNSWDRNAHNCALVCRTWHLPACRVLYEKINIPISARKLIRCLVEQKENMGIFCKVLRILSDFDNEIALDGLEFAQLLSYLPNVKRIELDEYRHTRHYLRLFMEQAHLLPNIREITSPFGIYKPREAQLYNECLLAFKDTIQHIRLQSLDTTIYRADGRSGNIVSFLPDFKTLQDLQIFNANYNPISGIPRIGVFTALRSCSSLKRFSIRSTFPEETEEDDYEKPFDHSKLDCLEIDVPELTKKQINYIVTSINKLKIFKLRSGYGTAYDPSQTPEKWLEKIGSKNLYDFCKYLANIDSVNLLSGEMYAMNIAELWPFVRNVIINKVKLPLHLSIMMDDTKELYQDSRFILVKEERGIYLHYGLGKDEVSSTMSTTDEIIPFDYSQISIQSMVLYIRPPTEKMIELTPALDLMDSVLNTIPNLHYLHVRIGPALNKALQIKVGSEDLKFDRDPYNFEIQGTEPPQVSRSLTDRLKHVLVQNTKSIKDLTSILRRLPNTKYLKLFDSKLDKDKNSNMTLDFRDLDLQYFMFDIGNIIDRSNDKQMIVLQVEEKQSSEVLLYRWQRETYPCQVVNFERISANFFKTDRQFKSRSTTFLIIQCLKIEEIKICLNDHQYVSATIDIGGRDNLKSD